MYLKPNESSQHRPTIIEKRKVLPQNFNLLHNLPTTAFAQLLSVKLAYTQESQSGQGNLRSGISSSNAGLKLIMHFL